MPDPAFQVRAAAFRNVAGAIVVATIVGCGLSLAIALVAVRLDIAGFNARAIGINTAAGGIATLLGAPFIPWAARRFGVVRLLMASLVLGGAALFGFTLSTNYWVWLALRFVIGFVVTVEFVLSEFWITSGAPSDRRGLAIGTYAASLAVGFAIGPIILAAIGTAGDVPFYFGAILFVGAAVPLALNARGAPPLETRSAKTFLTVLREAPAATLAAVLHGSIEVAGMSLLPVYALRGGGSVAEGALFASLFIFGSGSLQLPLGALADRIDRGRLLLALAAVGACGAIALALVGPGHRLVFEILLVAWGGAVGGLYPVGLSQLATLYDGADLASANSTFVMAYAVGMLAGPPLAGVGLDLLPPEGFFYAICVMAAVYVVISGIGLAQRSGRPRSS